MDLQTQQFTIDDVRDWPHHPDNEFWDFELLEGVVIPRVPHAYAQGVLAASIAFHLYDFVKASDAGFCTIGSGYYPTGENDTLVGPDVAFLSHARDPHSHPDEWVSAMPDIAVEMFEPWDVLADARWKAEVYLRKGTSLFWLVRPAEREIDVSRKDASGNIQTKLLSELGVLTGEDILPGFELEVSDIFAVLR